MCGIGKSQRAKRTATIEEMKRGTRRIHGYLVTKKKVYIFCYDGMLFKNLTIRSLQADIVMDDPSPQIDNRE